MRQQRYYYKNLGKGLYVKVSFEDLYKEVGNDWEEKAKHLHERKLNKLQQIGIGEIQ